MTCCCKRGNCTLVGHIVLTSVIPVVIFFSTNSTWFIAQKGKDSSCPEEVSVNLWKVHSQSCYGGSETEEWPTYCDRFEDDQNPRGCSMWLPALGFHYSALVILFLASGFGCAQACGCCCDKGKGNLWVSMSLTTAALALLLNGFVLFTSAKSELILPAQQVLHPEDPDFFLWGAPAEADYRNGWGWHVSIMASILVGITLLLVCIAGFFQDAPLLPSKDAGGNGDIPVGKPVPVAVAVADKC